MRCRFQCGEQIYDVSIERSGQGFRATVNGEPYELTVLEEQPGVLSLHFDGRPVTLHWAADGTRKWISLDGCTYLLDRPTSNRRATPHEDTGGEAVVAPMPAQVLSVQTTVGQTVEKGAPILLLEAMKMEIQIKAPAGGRVRRVFVTEGQTVEKDQVLAEIGD